MSDEIELKPIIGSSNIKAVGYDEDKQELQIEFIGGGLYAYDSVSPEIHEALKSAKSAGKYFHANIRDKFTTRKLK